MRTRTMGSAGARRSPLADERGMLLVITMIILLVVSTLAAANLINAFLERSIARNQAKSTGNPAPHPSHSRLTQFQMKVSRPSPAIASNRPDGVSPCAA